MTSSQSGVPRELRERVLADLRPVRPLADPRRRALLLAPLALVLLGVVHALFGTRSDVGVVMVWGLSLVQIAVGIVAASGAMREVIPDRQLRIAGRTAVFVGGFALAVAITYFTWYVSRTIAPPAFRYPFWKTCLRHTIEAGVPVLLVLLLLAARGVMWRPAVVGGLAGLAAGLIGDASWRTFCNVSEPAHVLTAHFAGIVVLAILGVLSAELYVWLVAALSAHSRR